MGSEALAARAWGMYVLGNDGVLQAGLGDRWFANQAPAIDPSTNLLPIYPLGIVHAQVQGDRKSMGAKLMYSKILLMVKIIGENTGHDLLAPLNNRAYELLDRAPSATFTYLGNQYSIMACQRTKELDPDSSYEDGERYDSCGAYFSLLCAPA